MSESSLIHEFRSCWQKIAQQFWPETLCEQLAAELARLGTELGRRQCRLLLSRKKMEKLHDGLRRRERRLAQFVAPDQRTPANIAAIAEREILRQSVDRLRERLQTRERSYARHLARFRERKQEWAKLRERLLSDSLPKRTSEESDPDYPF